MDVNVFQIRRLSAKPRFIVVCDVAIVTVEQIEDIYPS